MIPRLGFFAANKRRAAGPVSDDPHWDDVVLRMNFDGAEDATGYRKDYSPLDHTVTANLSAGQTSDSKFGDGAHQRTGTGSSSYLSVPDSDAFHFGSGDFTIECWYKPDSDSQTLREGIISQYLTSGNQRGWMLSMEGDDIEFYWSDDGSGINVIESQVSNASADFIHVVGERFGNTFTLYIDGAIAAQDTFSGSLNNSTQEIQIGGYNDSNARFGIVDDVRITKGVARYEATAFTPPTEAYPIE